MFVKNFKSMLKYILDFTKIFKIIRNYLHKWMSKIPQIYRMWPFMLEDT